MKQRMDSEAMEYPTEFIRRCGEAGYLGLAIASEAAGNIGAGREALRIAAEYSDTRRAFGRKLRDFQAISFRLAEMVTAVDAGRLLLLRAARKMDRGE